MKKKLYNITVIVIFALLVSNVFLFASALTLEEETARLEEKSSQLRVDNHRLRTTLSRLTSLEFLKTAADELEFDKKANVAYFEEPEYAVVPQQYE